MKEFNGYKKCSKCGDVFPICMFSKNKCQPDGLHDQCKDCCSEYKKKYHKENKAKVNERKRKWYEDHKEEMKKYNKKYHKAHSEVRRRKDAKRAGYQDAVEIFDNPFPSWIEIEFHHIDNHHVIPIPKVIHCRYKARRTREEHQAALKPIIEELYGISYQHMINR